MAIKKIFYEKVKNTLFILWIVFGIGISLNQILSSYSTHNYLFF